MDDLGEEDAGGGGGGQVDAVGEFACLLVWYCGSVYVLGWGADEWRVCTDACFVVSYLESQLAGGDGRGRGAGPDIRAEERRESRDS